MTLPPGVMRLFTDPGATKVIATTDVEGTVHAAPFASLAPTPDGSALFFSQGAAEETPKRLAYMKQAEKMPVVVVQLVDVGKNVREGYSICCKVGDSLTSGPLYDKASERVFKLTGNMPRAVWTLHPIRYKTHTPGPDRGKVVTL